MEQLATGWRLVYRPKSQQYVGLNRANARGPLSERMPADVCVTNHCQIVIGHVIVYADPARLPWL
jgi:hypothetical protein